MSATNRMISRTMAVPISVAAGASTDVGDCFGQGLAVYLSGAMTATYQLQVSPDGAAWINLGSALTAAGTVVINQSCLAVRWNCTAYTSGAPTSFVCGAPL